MPTWKRLPKVNSILDGLDEAQREIVENTLDEIEAIVENSDEEETNEEE